MEILGGGERTTDLEVGEEGLFVERCLLETEGVDDVVDLCGALFQGIVAVLSRWVGT